MVILLILIKIHISSSFNRKAWNLGFYRTILWTHVWTQIFPPEAHTHWDQPLEKITSRQCAWSCRGRHTHSVLPVWHQWSCWPWVKLGYQAQGFQHMEQPAPAQITQETNQLSASQHQQEAGVASSRDRFDLCQWWLTWLLALLLASTYQVRVSCVWTVWR